MKRAYIGLALCLLAAACGDGGKDGKSGPDARAGCGDGASGIVVTGPWVRTAPQGQTNSAAYFTLCNATGEPDALVGVSTPEAGAAEMHESTQTDDGMMTMSPVSSLDLPPGEPVRFAPGGYHVMLIGLFQPIAAGDELSLTLKFRNAPPETIKAVAKAPGVIN